MSKMIGEVVRWVEQALKAQCDTMWVQAHSSQNYFFKYYLQNSACSEGLFNWHIVGNQMHNNNVAACKHVYSRK